DVLALCQAAQADQIRVSDRDHDLGVVGQKTQVIEAARLSRLGRESFADLLHHGNSVVRIDNFFPDSETNHLCLLERILNHARLQWNALAELAIVLNSEEILNLSMAFA